MKTIAITIDENTLKRINQLMANEQGPYTSRSELIRQAVQEFVDRLERLAEDERERRLFRKHRKRLHHESVALVKEQAKL